MLAASCRREPEPLELVVDEALSPRLAAAPPLADGVPRPIGRLVGPSGAQTDFVENELLVETEDPASVAALAARYGGTVVAHHDLSTLEGGVHFVLVRIDPRRVDAAALEQDLGAVAATAGLEGAGGRYRVSSDAARRLFAAAARERARGHAVLTPNFVFYPNTLATGSTAEWASSPEGIRSDACSWPYMNSGSAQDIGVCAAWQALHGANRLGSRTRALVVDGGFDDSPDTPPGSVFLVTGSPQSSAPDPPVMGTIPCSGGGTCPWHGTAVSHALAAVPDNGWGAAGPGGPVTELIELHREFTDVNALVQSTAAMIALRPRIVNMSFGGAIDALPAVFASAVTDPLFEMLHANSMMLVASAGNDGRLDVDQVDTLWGWEAQLQWPCESNRVFCVAGLAPESRMRDGGSSFGSRFGTEAGTVELFGPFCVYTGEDPGDGLAPGMSTIKPTCGTSVAAPFVAGVASLVWAADPRLSVDQVESILRSTAHRGRAGEAPAWVNAYEAVVRALGNAPPRVTITAPAPGARVDAGFRVGLHATISDREDAAARLRVVWTDQDGNVLANAASPTVTFVNAGTRTLTATVTDRGGFTSMDQVTIAVVDDPGTSSPGSFVITSPTPGQEVLSDRYLSLSGSMIDPEGNLPLSYRWVVTAYAVDGVTVYWGPQTVATGADARWLPTSGPGRPLDRATCQNMPGQRIEIRLVAVDSLGNESTSRPVRVEGVCSID